MSHEISNFTLCVIDDLSSDNSLFLTRCYSESKRLDVESYLRFILILLYVIIYERDMLGVHIL